MVLKPVRYDELKKARNVIVVGFLVIEIVEFGEYVHQISV